MVKRPRAAYAVHCDEVADLYAVPDGCVGFGQETCCDDLAALGRALYHQGCLRPIAGQ